MERDGTAGTIPLHERKSDASNEIYKSGKNGVKMQRFELSTLSNKFCSKYLRRSCNGKILKGI